MANTAANIQKLYIAYFNRPADPAGLAYWMNSSMTIGQIANSFGAQAEYNAAFAGQTTESIIATLYQNLFGHAPDVAGLLYWTGQVNGGMSTIGNVAINIVSGATGVDAATVNAKVTAATSFTTAIDTTAEILAYSKPTGTAAAKAWLSAVTTDATAATQIIKQDATLAAIVATDAGTGATSGATNQMTVGQDVLTGTVGNDTFNAPVAQNSLGQQVNTLGSGDVLNGGAGKDTLAAKITNGAFVGNSGNGSMAIQPETKGVELIKLQAVLSTVTTDAPSVYVNAKDMQGVEKITSNYSDASLVVQNMTTKDDSGNARTLSKLTVGMEYTGNQDTKWKASDMSVYFDQDYLNPDITFTNPSIDFRLMNEDAYDQTVGTTSFRPLDGVYVGQMDVTVNGTVFSLAPGLGENKTSTGTGSEIKTYAELLAAVNTSIAALKAANPTNVALQSLTAKLGATFTSDISPTTGALRSGTTITLTIDGTTDGVQNTMTVKPTDLQILRAQAATVNNNNRYESASATPSDKGQVLSINVDLEKVGLAGDGGALLVGSMFKDSTNVYKDAYIGKGIDQFDVKVSGGVAKPSSLSSMASTGNNLKTVNVTTNALQTGDFAALTIGNTVTKDSTGASTPLSKLSTPSANNYNALKDVKTFNASALKGDLTLFAGLSNEVTAKYLNLKDVGVPSGDNVAFTYTSGTGNDYINLFLNADNLAAPGTSSREDMTLSVSTGEGNDTIVVKVDTAAPSNWYANQKINANLKFASGVATGQLQLNGDAGNDTIRKLGSGDFAINGGLGDDTIYSDNTGAQVVTGSYNEGRATWLFNSSRVAPNDADITNVLSLAGTTTASAKVVNLQLTVAFRGVTKTVNVGTSMNSTTGVAVTDLMINNAIKDAINSDAVLSKLLVAEDGPGHALVVKALIDDLYTDFGVASTRDVTVSLSSTALTAAQTAVGSLVQLPAADSTLLGFGAVVGGSTAVALGRFDSLSALDGAGGVAIVGAESTAVTDNIIVGGMGNDVIVLATNKTVGTFSNETVAYAAGAFGNDTIVNFQIHGTNGADKLDFTALGGSGAASAALMAFSTTNKAISVVLETTTNDTVAEIKAFYDAAGIIVAQTYVYVAYDANNIGKVYTVVDGTGAADTVVTLVGTIDLADTTGWASLNGTDFV